LEKLAEAGPRSSIAPLYGLFDQVRSGDGAKTWSVTFRPGFARHGGLRTTVLDQAGTKVFSGTLPSVRPAREDNRDLLRWRLPAVMVRRSDENLSSLFAAVHEPFAVSPQLTVERLPLRGAPADAAGMVCRGDGFIDYHLSGLDAGSHLDAAAVPFSMTGRYGFVRTRAGRPVQMVLLDGTRLRFGGQSLTAPAPVSGKVLAVRSREAGAGEDALLVDALLPPRAGRPDERVLVEFGDGSTYALAVRELRQEGGHTVVLLANRPGFSLTADGQTATQTHIPHRTIRGQPRFRLPQCVAWSAEHEAL
jgi:hypothetical protein